MIRMPQRSVTRFFIPLIDVLLLLFCIFLLMPLVEDPAARPASGAPGDRTGDPDAANAAEQPVTAEDLKRQQERLRQQKAELDRERQEVRQLATEKIQILQKRLAIRVLEIDADTGRLYFQDGDQRVPVDSQAEALQWIDRHKQEAAGQELYYLFLYPRRLTGYPEQGQIKKYERWFEGVAHGIDNPRGRR